MKLLPDACVWGGARKGLQSGGHDVVWAGEWPEDPGDEEILARAHREGCILVTLDKDFGELAIVRRSPHCGILRLVGPAARQQAAVRQQVLNLHGEHLQTGAIVTAQAGHLRIRPPEHEGER